MNSPLHDPGGMEYKGRGIPYTLKTLRRTIMKKHFKYTPVALAVAALVASPLAFAGEYNGDEVSTSKTVTDKNVDFDHSVNFDRVDIDIEKDFTYEENVDVEINVSNPDLEGGTTTYSRAIVDTKQSNMENEVQNGQGNGPSYMPTLDEGDDVAESVEGFRGHYNGSGHSNEITIDNNALRDASGNIGVNLADGDYNQQQNSAALAAADAASVFGVADAQAHSSQDNELNDTWNYGASNTVTIGNNALRNATGNIGVNIATGTGNQQKNNLAGATTSGGVGLAMVTMDQESDRNYTHNQGTEVHRYDVSFHGGSIELDGTYNGISDQVGDLFPDLWSNDPGDDPVHGTNNPGPTGHADFDSAAQGAVDRPQEAPDGSVSNGGALSFNEAGDIELSGSYSGGAIRFWNDIIASSNSITISNNALRGATGNIGVNIAAGTGNQQNNSLAISSGAGDF